MTRVGFLVVLVVAMCASTLAGCTTTAGQLGTNAPPAAAVPKSPPELTPEESVVVANFEVDVASVVLNGSHYRQLLDSSDAVIALARQKPDAIYPADKKNRTMRQVIGDAASDLSQYQPALSKKFELAVQTLPQQK